MGTLTSPLVRGKDVPSNAVMLNETIPDYTGAPMEIPRAIAIFERYAGRNISIRRWVSRTSVPSVVNWWCAG
jgi:Cu2+-containing amine oxidase